MGFIFSRMVCPKTLFCFNAFHGSRVFIFDAKSYTILILHVYFPSLKPFETDYIADVFALLNIIKFIPVTEILNQLFFQLFFFENIKNLLKLVKIKKL